jgi:uncharacterized protein (TIGR03435 family)
MRIANLCALGVMLALVPTSSAQDTSQRFEVASVKQNSGDAGFTFTPDPVDGFRRTNYPLFDGIIRYAYELQPFRVIGAPEWTRNDRFDIVAKAARPISEAERRLMVRTLLAERFRMKSHFEMRDHTVYLMKPGRTDNRLGPGLKPRPECESSPCQSGGSGRADAINIRAVTLKQFAEGMLSAVRGELVYDETGVPGRFDVQLSFRPDTSTDPDDTRPALVTAIQEQLWLKLEPQRRSIEVLVIDSIDRPTPD